MTMSQAATDSHQAGPMTNGCDAPNELSVEPMDLTATPGPMSNGDSQSTKMMDSNGDGGDLAPGQLSPNSARRRSTRASAIKAAEKIKLKDDGSAPADGEAATNEDEDMVDEDADEGAASAAKKRRLMDGSALDQYSHTFYIKEEGNGDICEVSDDSEISSLHSEEVSVLRTGYEKILNKELSDEQKRERHSMVKRCESELRLEEARLMLMKKITSSQMIAAQKAIEAKKMTPNIAMNTAGHAYKPAMAMPKSSTQSKSSTSSSTANRSNPMLAMTGMTLAQQQEFLTRATANNPQVANQLLQLMVANAKGSGSGAASQAQLTALMSALVQQQQQQQQQQKEAQAKEALLKEQQHQQQTAQQSVVKAFAALTPQQRATNARQAFRSQAEKQLQQMAFVKSHPVDLPFVPNPGQLDCCGLVALELIVQTQLKDKAARANVTEGPYMCEECNTDFTPSWKAIGNKDDLHLYCEQCVRDTQKKKIQKDHSSFLRKAFNKVATQEKEFEKQIADGKLDAAMQKAAEESEKAAAAAQTQHHQASAAAATASSSGFQAQAQNLSIKQNGTSTPTPKTSTPIPSSTPKSSNHTPQNSKKSGSSHNSMSQLQQQQAHMALLMRSNPMMAAAMMSGMGGASGGSASSQANAMSNVMQQFQSQAASMMYNPMMMQMFAAAAQQQQANSRAQQASHKSQQQQQQQPNVAAMALLAQAAMQSASAQAQGSGNSSSNAAASAAAQLQAQMAQQLGALSPANLMNNPQLIRQLQERMNEHYKRNGKK